jgi:hypothetical protein
MSYIENFLIPRRLWLNLANTPHLQISSVRGKKRTVWAQFQAPSCANFGAFNPSHLYLIGTVFTFQLYRAGLRLGGAEEWTNLDYVNVAMTVDAKYSVAGLNARFCSRGIGLVPSPRAAAASSNLELG